MSDKNYTYPNYSIDFRNSEKKEIAKSGNLAILVLTKSHKDSFKNLLYDYIYKFNKDFWLNNINNNKIKTKAYIIKSVENILSEKIFKKQNIHQAIFSNIEKYLKKNNLTLQNLESLKITHGKLYIILDNGDFLSYNLAANTLDDLILQTKTKENLKELKEEQNVVTKIVMWGSLVTLTYSQFVEFGDWGDKALDKASRNFGDMKKQKFLKEIEVEIGNGNKVKINVSERIKEFGDGKIGQVELRNILKKQGIVFNPEKNQFEETVQRKLNKAVEAIEYKSIVKRIKTYSYLEYKTELINAGIPNNERLSEVEFEKAKKDNIKILKELNRQFNAGKNKNLRFGTYLKSKYLGGFFEKVGSKALHVIMMPIFFKEIHKHSGNLDSYVKGGVEVVTFMAGAKLGGKIPGPALLKLVSGILTGGVAAVGGHETLKFFDKEFLAKMPNREDYFKRIGFENEASFAGWAFGGFVNDIADGLNTDVGLNFNKPIKLFNPHFEEKKYLDIDLFNNNINLGTGVIDYLNERTRGVEHWNKEVEEFRIRATKEINSKILSKKFKYSDVFKDDNWFGSHSFEESLSDILKTFDTIKEKDQKAFIFNEDSVSDLFSKKIFEFSKNNIPKDLLLGTFIDKNNPDKTKVFDKIKEKLKVFLKENKILTKTEDIENFILYYESIFYTNISEKIDDILGNPNTVESLLGSSGDIHNTTQNIKEGLKRTILNNYFSLRLERKNTDIVESEDNKVTKEIKQEKIEKNMSFIEVELKAEIDRLKIDDQFIKEYKEIITNDNILLKKALEGKIDKDSIKKIGDYIFIADKDGKYYRSYGNVDDLIYVSKLSKEDRDFTNEIFKKILHPERGMILEGPKVELNTEGYLESLDHHSTMTSKQFEINSKILKFEKLLENDNYYIFFNRMIDFKRRKVFIENVEKYGDSEEQVIRTNVVNKVSEILDWF